MRRRLARRERVVLQQVVPQDLLGQLRKYTNKLTYAECVLAVRNGVLVEARSKNDGSGRKTTAAAPGDMQRLGEGRAVGGEGEPEGWRARTRRVFSSHYSNYLASETLRSHITMHDTKNKGTNHVAFHVQDAHQPCTFKSQCTFQAALQHPPTEARPPGE